MKALIAEALKKLRTAVYILVHTLHDLPRGSDQQSSLLWNRINQCLFCQAKAEMLDHNNTPEIRRASALSILLEVMSSKSDTELPLDLESKVLKLMGALQLDAGNIEEAMSRCAPEWGPASTVLAVLCALSEGETSVCTNYARLQSEHQCAKSCQPPVMQHRLASLAASNVAFEGESCNI